MKFLDDAINIENPGHLVGRRCLSVIVSSIGSNKLMDIGCGKEVCLIVRISEKMEPGLYRSMAQLRFTESSTGLTEVVTKSSSVQSLLAYLSGIYAIFGCA